MPCRGRCPRRPALLPSLEKRVPQIGRMFCHCGRKLLATCRPAIPYRGVTPNKMPPAGDFVTGQKSPKPAEAFPLGLPLTPSDIALRLTEHDSPYSYSNHGIGCAANRVLIVAHYSRTLSVQGRILQYSQPANMRWQRKHTGANPYSIR